MCYKNHFNADKNGKMPDYYSLARILGNFIFDVDCSEKKKVDLFFNLKRTITLKKLDRAMKTEYKTSFKTLNTHIFHSNQFLNSSNLYAWKDHVCLQ